MYFSHRSPGVPLRSTPGFMLAAAPRASDIFNDGLLVRPLTYDLRDACGRAVSLPAVAAYAGVATTATIAQGKRNRRATCECAESSACGGCVCSQSFATETQRHGAKPGIEEQHNRLRPTRTMQDRVQRFSSLRSRRKHKAWGVSPRIESPTTIEPAKRAIEVQNPER
jgi:hypothetical protein